VRRAGGGRGRARQADGGQRPGQDQRVGWTGVSGGRQAGEDQRRAYGEQARTSGRVGMSAGVRVGEDERPG